MNGTQSTTMPSRKEAFELYENGKHRRYSLLFAVNGGAFAVAKLLTPGGAAEHVLGHLELVHLVLGMTAFSSVMVWDIWTFGEKMRTTYIDDVFGKVGKKVLLLIGALLCGGWLMVGFGGA